MKRKKIVAGNWKMNKSLQEAQTLVEMIVKQVNEFDDVIKIIIPPFPYLHSVGQILSQNKNFFTGAQNCHTQAQGAFTGEVSASILASVGCNYVVIGHSERRNYFKETNEELILKLKQALAHNLQPIFCIGETLQERKADNHFQVVSEQLNTVLKPFTDTEFKQMILAYEPVWAIGTGETATPEQAQEMHAFIRKTIKEIYSEETAEQTSILYGGSCNAQNAQELFSCKDVDGGLIGGASLNADDFCKIIFSF